MDWRNKFYRDFTNKKYRINERLYEVIPANSLYLEMKGEKN